jgi:hypothetical protein
VSQPCISGLARLLANACQEGKIALGTKSSKIESVTKTQQLMNGSIA